MRILHTADWHLGSSLGGFDRTEEQFGQVEKVLRLARTHQVDLLLVAGDLFERSRRLPELTKRLANLLREDVEAGLHVLLLPGNHDNREQFRMMHALLALDGAQEQRVHVADGNVTFDIDGVQFVIVPYPIRELLEAPGLTHSSPEARSRTISARYAELIQELTGALDPGRPSVLVAHVTIAGVTTPLDYEINDDRELRLGRDDLPSNLSYIALGHIHQQQQIDHSVPCWYSGSIERLNMGERADQKGVLLVDLPPHGPAQVLPYRLEATPFLDLHLKSSDVASLAARFPNLARAFVRVEVECEPGDEPLKVQREIKQICPRLLDLNVKAMQAEESGPIEVAGFAETALAYLDRQFAADHDLIELRAKATELIKEVENASA